MAACGPKKIDSSAAYAFEFDAKQVKQLPFGGFVWELKFQKVSPSGSYFEKKEKENAEIIVKGSGTVIDFCNSISEQLKKLNAVLQMSEQSKEKLSKMLQDENRKLPVRYNNTADISIATLMGQINTSNTVIASEEKQDKKAKM